MTRQKTEREPIAERFARDIQTHEMEIRLDCELYRHVVFKRPNTVCMMFSLTTTPGRLIYAGDMGCFVFQRLPDMFEFFRNDRPDRRPNFGYWHEKLVAEDREGSLQHDVDTFRENLESYLTDDMEQAERDEVTEFIDDVVEKFEESGPQIAYAEVHEFSLTPKDGGRRTRHQFFTDFWDRSDRIYTLRFEWACHAIQHGIAVYDAAKASQPTENERSKR
jgi:hypothetical protein